MDGLERRRLLYVAATPGPRPPRGVPAPGGRIDHEQRGQVDRRSRRCFSCRRDRLRRARVLTGRRGPGHDHPAARPGHLAGRHRGVPVRAHDLLRRSPRPVWRAPNPRSRSTPSRTPAARRAPRGPGAPALVQGPLRISDRPRRARRPCRASTSRPATALAGAVASQAIAEGIVGHEDMIRSLGRIRSGFGRRGPGGCVGVLAGDLPGHGPGRRHDPRGLRRPHLPGKPTGRWSSSTTRPTPSQRTRSSPGSSTTHRRWAAVPEGVCRPRPARRCRRHCSSSTQPPASRWRSER